MQILKYIDTYLLESRGKFNISFQINKDFTLKNITKYWTKSFRDSFSDALSSELYRDCCFEKQPFNFIFKNNPAF